jgi:DNA-binding CsgD family transcriptional regulator/GAF domain-containing protein
MIMDSEVPKDARRASALLSAAEDVLDDGVPYARAGREPGTLTEALDAARHALSDRADRHTAAVPDADVAREQALALQLGGARSALRGSMAGQQAPIAEVSSLLRALRAFSSLDDLVDGAPGEIHRVGFSRVLVSRIQGSLWLARSASVAGNPGLSAALVSMGREYPGTLAGPMVEADVVRRVKPILVHDAFGNARVHKRLRDVIDCRAYVCAPLVVHGAVAGLLHADRDAGSGLVDSFDKDMLSAVAEGLGFAIERVVFMERLQALRRRLDEHTRTVSDLIDEFTNAEVELSATTTTAPSRPPQRRRGPAWEDGDDEFPFGLTRREFDVLRRMALGETNVQIGHRLFVSEGTVKSHVKHILRKLDAANRAEAVSRYHLMTRDTGYSPRGR